MNEVEDQALFSSAHVGNAVVLSVRGEVDIANADMLRTAMRDSARTGESAVVVSLVDVSYLDSHTLELLVDLSRKLHVHRRSMAIVAPSGGPARRLIDVCGISKVIGVFDTVEQALGAIASSG